ncbi:type II secretion system protein GspE [bacterium]|nr:MAG: type II secretion system protein GspE [bacterium]
MPTLKDTIIDVLIKSARITQAQLDKALEIQKEKRIPLRKVLIKENLISEEELLSLLSNRLFLPTLHLTKYKFDPEIVRIIPEHISRQYCLLVLSRMGNILTVAMSDPLNVFALDDLKVITGCRIDIVLSPEEEILKALDAQYSPKARDLQQIVSEETTKEEAISGKDLELIKDDAIELSSVVKESEKPLIVKLVDLMLTEALKKRASDIHIEPEEDGVRVRYRIDGALHDILKLPRKNQNAVIARLKIISDMDITENRIPQDGRFKVKFDNKEVDFRVSSLPVTFGQKFVLRALDKTNLSIGLDKLGFSPKPAAIFKEAITKPFGMILVTGPTGSGKSTTLYSVLTQMNTPDKNIVTIEDPVEYQIEGITQVQVKPDIGLNFSSGLRSILRQSPDVILIGEIRDGETADIAVKASLTGQIVLSTLHTNDAITSITRLIDMGAEPFLVASSLVMLCAQRLCRRLCPKCRKPVEIPQDYLDSLGIKDKKTFYQAQGCKYCNNTGFYGRIAVLEAILIDDTMRDMIIKRKSIDEIREYAITKCAMATLRDDALLKAKEDYTTLEEALRITKEE